MEYLIYDNDVELYVESQRRNICEELVDELISLRKSRNMTQQDISNITGIQRPNIARFEGCTTTPTIDILIKYATALGYKVNISLEENEGQRLGRNKDTLVNESYISGGEYKKKIDLITSDKEMNRVIYCKAKEMLFHRSGSEFEDMYWFDLDTKSVLCCKLDETNIQEIRHTKSINKQLQNCDTILALHTHPHSMPPSAEDFNCFIDFDYAVAAILCHDGTVYMYSAKNYISPALMALEIQKEYKLCNDERKAQIRAIEKFVKNGDIWLKEVRL